MDSATSLILAPIIGRVVRFDGKDPAVDFPGNPARGPAIARTTVTLGPWAVGREAVLLFENGDPARPLVMGLVQLDEPRTVETEVDDERMVLSSSREVVLKCGAASITLTRAGKVLIRGTYLLSRSKGVHLIQGGSVRIN